MNSDWIEGLLVTDLEMSEIGTKKTKRTTQKLKHICTNCVSRVKQKELAERESV